MQYVDCDRAEKHGNLCLGYGYEEIDEPCEQCKNCIKCESGYYQLGETEKDDQLEQAKQIIKDILLDSEKWDYKDLMFKPLREQAEQFIK